MRRILHLDMDAFFAAVELLRHPHLKGRPLVVGGRGDPTRRGVVSTASYEARRYGIHSGMPLRTAWERCPEAVFLPVDYAAYAAASGKIKAILRGFSALMEDVGIDESYIDISDSRVPPEAIARSLKARIREATGLTCSIGIAPNKLLAKIASDMDKPDGLTIITGEDIENRIWPLPVRKLAGVGPKTEERLARIRVRTVGDLAQQSLATLIEHFGRAHGEYLHRASRGIDDRPLVTHWEPRSISRETTFQRDVADMQGLRDVLADLTESVAGRLQRRGYLARGVTVKLRFADFDTHTRSITLHAPSDNPDALRTAALALLDRFELTRRVRLIGVRLSGFERRETQPGEAVGAHH